MLFIFLYVCLLAVFGFFLAIVTGVIAKEEITVGSGMVMIFIAGIISGIAGFAVAMNGLDSPLIGSLIRSLVFFGSMVALLVLMGKVPAAKASLVSAIFSAVYLVAMTIIAMSLRVPDQAAQGAPMDARPLQTVARIA